MKIYTFLLAIVAVSAHANAFKAKTSGNWIAPATWSCNCVPQSGDQVTIPEGITVTITRPVTAPLIQITVSGELQFNNGMLQINAGDKVIVLPGGKVVAKGMGGAIFVGTTAHYFEHGKVIAGPSTIGKTVAPVALVSFKANSNEGQVTLSWASVGDVNVKRYEILSSIDSVTFQSVGVVKTVKGSGYPLRRKDYTFPVGSSLSVGFYRLEAVRTGIDSSHVVLSTVAAR